MLGSVRVHSFDVLGLMFQYIGSKVSACWVQLGYKVSVY